MYLTSKEIAACLKISRQKLYYMRKQGRFIDASIFGRSVRFLESDFNEWRLNQPIS